MSLKEKALKKQSLARRAGYRLLRIALLFCLVIALLSLCAYFVMYVDPGPYEGQVEEPTKEKRQPLAEVLRGHVVQLSETIGPRNTVHFPEPLEQAAVYIEKSLTDWGYEVNSLPYDVKGTTVRNLEVTRPGTDLADEIILIGAHYDSWYEAPGANDNASGTAILMELARKWATRPAARRTVRFVAFTNEEPPHFQRDTWGARVYAKAARKRGDDIRAMLSLETLGYYDKTAGSQKYPPVFDKLYPSTGTFVGIVGNIDSRMLVRRITSYFREATTQESECVATFGWIHGIGWSDHAAFWEQDYPAVMLTDTAPFRYPYYHKKKDLPKWLNYDVMARITLAVDHVLDKLANPE